MQLTSLALRTAAAAALAASWLAGTACHAAPPSAASACPTAALRAAKAAKWQVDDSARRQALALQAVSCLASPDPVERDELAFEGLQTWMRTDKLDTAALQELRTRLSAQLQAPDPQGFARPFAALVLADVARVDRIKPYLSAEQRAQLVGAATGYLRGVADYRGFDEKQGWRHGVAHAADIMLQLALNPALGRAEHEPMLAAIAGQVAPPGEHFYRYGEGERLMAPIFYLSRARTLECADWDAWFAGLAARPTSAGAQQAALARKHNLNGFLQPLYVNISESKDEAQRNCLKPLLLRALKQAAE
ncbi:DUF2785 domain-containing protein [Duganella sp. Root336D2]|uniref:DUF2785 domain-containing protein n=1 Tax=Duganella sp. Root336D2 TaxID=1736518 RepID=UPI0006FAEF70|nr:DUF2785 domain-containing protein [Duganella sp. Root336D2]KQV42987.1 hypothetical protein ASD07_21335 [Duganella sp. Root336D2]